MGIKNILTIATASFKRHLPEIKTILKVSGVFFSAIETAKVAIKADRVLDDLRRREDWKELEIQEKAKEVIKGVGPEIVLPPLLIGATAGGIIYDDKKTLASQMATMTLYKTTKRELENMKYVVADTLGDVRNRKEITSKLAKRDASEFESAIIYGSEGRLFLDAPNGRPFLCTEERMEAAKNRVDALLNSGKTVTANEFYEFLHLPEIEGGDDVYLGIEYREDVDYSENDALNNQFFYDIVRIPVENDSPLRKYDDTIRVIYYDLKLMK